MSAQPPSNPNPLDEIKNRLQESPDELRAGLADKEPLLQDAKPRYAFGWFDKWMLAIPIGIGVIILLILWSSCRGTPAPTTATLNTPEPNATLQVNEPLTITGTAPPNSTVQILNHGEVVAETVADEDGNFVVRFNPQQPGDYELQAVATVDGNPLESVPIQFVIAAAAGQAGLSGQPTAENQTAVAAAQATATAPSASDSGTAAPGTEGSAQSGTPVAGTEGNTQGATPAPGTEGSAQGATPAPGAEGNVQGATPAPSIEGSTQGGTSAPTTASLQAPAAGTTVQAGESVTIIGSAPPNSTVQIYNQGQIVAETKADANGQFVVSVVPNQAGTFELTAVATTPDGTTLESPPVQFVIAESSGQTPETLPTTAIINTPAADTAQQAGESLTITGTAPPNSTVQIYNEGQLVAEAKADANGNFVVSFVPDQAGTFELEAVATAPDGTTVESAPMQFVIVESSGQTPAPGQTAPANQTSIAAANGTPVPGTEGGTQGGAQAGTTVPGTEGSASAPTTAAINAPAADATLQAGESLTITGTAPPNSTVQIYNQGQVVAETKADANGNFVVSFVPAQAGTFELNAVVTAPDGTTLESAPMQFVIAEGTSGPDAEGGEPAPTTVSIQAPATNAPLQAGESITITGTAPPNSTVQITNQGQVVAETKADANGNFVVSFVPDQAGTFELEAVATAPDGTTVESSPVQFVIAEGAEQTPIASADQNATSVAAAANGTPVPDSESGAQSGTPEAATSPETQGGAAETTSVPGTQGSASNATPVPETQSGAAGTTPIASEQGGAPGATVIPGTQGSGQAPTQVANAQGGTQGSANETQTPGDAGAQGSTTPQDSTGALAATPPTVHILAGQWLVPGNPIVGTGSPGSTVKIYLNDTEAGSATVGADGNWQFTLPIETGPGDYTLRIVTDSSSTGGAGAASESGSNASSKPIAISVVGLTLPVTGSPWWNCWPYKARR